MPLRKHCILLLVLLAISSSLAAQTHSWLGFAIAPQWDSYGINADLYINEVEGTGAIASAMKAKNPYQFDNVKFHDLLLAFDFEGANYFESKARFGLVYGFTIQKMLVQTVDHEKLDSMLEGNLGLKESDYHLGWKARVMLSWRCFFDEKQRLGIEMDGGAFFKYISARNDTVDLQVLYAGPSLQSALILNFAKHFALRAGIRLDIPLSNNIRLKMDLSERDLSGISHSVASAKSSKVYAEGSSGAMALAYNLMPFIGAIYNY